MAKRTKKINTPPTEPPDLPDDTTLDGDPDDTPTKKKATSPDDVLPMSAKGPNSLAEWRSRIKQSQTVIEDLQPLWDGNARRYAVKKRSTQDTEEILVPTIFKNVEQKKSQLMAQTPHVVVTPQHPDSVAAAPLFEAVLNERLAAPAPYGVDLMTAMEECLSDLLVPAGLCALHIGYEPTIDGVKEVQTGTKPDPSWTPPDPATLPPVLPGMPPPPPPQPPMVPVMATIPNVIFEKYYMDRLSPSKLLIPEEFTGSDFDRAAWLGFEGILDFPLAKRKWPKAPWDDFDSFVSSDDHLINADGDGRSQMTAPRKRVRYYLIYYRTAVFDKTVAHPYAMRLLVLVDGMKDTPACHQDSPFQWKNDDGSLGGMLGFPVHVGGLRYVSDSAYPPSDATMDRWQADEIDDGRSMMKLQRRRNIPVRLGDESKLGEGGVAKLEKGIWQSIILLKADAFADGQMPIKDVQQAAFPQENFTFDTLANRDSQATWGLGSAPGGSIPSGTASTSATQSSAAQASSASRIGRERNRLMTFLARGIEKLSILYQRFLTDDQYVQMIGPDGAQTLVAYNKSHIIGKFGFRILENSSVDQAEMRNDELQWYNLVSKSPSINHQALDMELVKSMGRDPAKLILPPQPPPPPAPALPHGIALSVDEKSLNPLNPAFPIVIALLKAAGVVIPDQAIAQAQSQSAKTGLPTADAGNVSGGQVPPPPPPMPPPGGPMPPGPGAPPPGGPQLQHDGAPKANVVDDHAFQRSGALNGPKVA
jgi:hypothetical protein